jgi:hypothetical protein
LRIEEKDKPENSMMMMMMMRRRKKKRRILLVSKEHIAFTFKVEK